MSGRFYDYLLIASAGNKANYIGQTIPSVCKRTVKPQAWIINSISCIPLTNVVSCDHETYFK